MFWLKFIHCTMVSPFVLPCLLSLWLVNEKVRNHWRGVNELYDFYLLNHANGQMHVCLIASLPSTLLLCTDSSQSGWFLVETYIIILFLGCDMPIQLVLLNEYVDRLEDHFIMYQFTSWTMKYAIFYAWIKRLTYVFLPVIYQYSCFFVLISAWQQA